MDRLLVLEELDPVIEEHCRNLGLTVQGEGRPCPSSGEFSQGLGGQKAGQHPPPPRRRPPRRRPPPGPVVAPDVPPGGCSTPLAKHKVTVLGDIGCYTLAAYGPPLRH